jgi:hypothetical protein
MKKITLSLLVYFVGLISMSIAQNIAITDDDVYVANAAAMLDVKSTSKGLLIPRVALVNATNPISAAKPSGLLVWNTNIGGSYTKVGFYFWNGADWEMVGSSNTFSNGLTQTGNSVKLGGSLGENTLITQGNNNLTFNSTGTGATIFNLAGTGDFDVQDNGVSYLFVGDNGNIGIGKNNPGQRLDINGNLKIGDNLSIEGTSAFGKYRNLATYSSNNPSSNGAFVINTNQSEATMFTMKISGYFFGSTGPYEVTIKGWWNGTSCTNAGYTAIGPDALAVRVGRNAGGSMVVILGNEASSYSYPKFTVTDFYQGYNAPNETLADGWTITQETSLVPYGTLVALNNTTTIDQPWNRSGSVTLLKNAGDKVGIGTAVPSSRLTVAGNTSGQIDDPLFEVKNNAGQTVFAVYNEGVRVYVNDDPTKATGTRGGFAVGGISSSKGFTSEYLRVTPDSVRVYVDPTTATKAAGSRGGFAVGGISGSKGVSEDWMRLTNFNYFIGHSSGAKTTGTYNLFLGFESGFKNVTGSNNTFLGYRSGYNNISGSDNVFIGKEAGYTSSSTSFNTYIGFQAGYNATSNYNTAVGYQAGFSQIDWQAGTFLGYRAGKNATGRQNVFLGSEAGIAFTTGGENVCIGGGAGGSNDSPFVSATGTANVFIGYYSGYKSGPANRNVILGAQSPFSSALITGSNNVYLGDNAGNKSGSASNNVFIGYNAGLDETGSNKLYIDNSSTASPLIYGDFNSNSVKINGSLIGVDITTNNDNPGLLGQHNVTTNYGVGIKGIGGYKGVEALNQSTSGWNYGVYSTCNGTNPSGTNYGVWSSASGAATNYAGYFSGVVYATSFTTSSDLRMKKNVIEIANALSKLKQIRGVYFEWDKSAIKQLEQNSTLSAKGNAIEGNKMKESVQLDAQFSDGKQIGVIAQEVESIMPEAVMTDSEGLKSVDYTKLIPLLIEAIKEQQKQIEDLKAQINNK